MFKVTDLGQDQKSDAKLFFLPDFCAIQPVFMLILFAQLLSIVFVLLAYPIWPFPWESLALISLFVQWISLTTASVLCLLKKPLCYFSAPVAALVCYALMLLIAFIFSVAAQWLIPLREFSFYRLEIDWLKIMQNMGVAGIIDGLILRYFYLSAQLEQQRRSELLHRLQALQSRIHPHFLFNSMNIVTSLIETDPQTAEQVVEDLADLFRASLNQVQEQVSLSKELDLCRRYLNIEQLRLGDRLQVVWDVPDHLPSQAHVPLLTLQPLIENAICHGVQPRSQGGKILIRCEHVANEVILEVINPSSEQSVQPLTQSSTSHHHNSIALDNIRHRLAALYDGKAQLITTRSGDYYLARLSFPCV